MVIDLAVLDTFSAILAVLMFFIAIFNTVIIITLRVQKLINAKYFSLAMFALMFYISSQTIEFSYYLFNKIFSLILALFAVVNYGLCVYFMNRAKQNGDRFLSFSYYVFLIMIILRVVFFVLDILSWYKILPSSPRIDL